MKFKNKYLFQFLSILFSTSLLLFQLSCGTGGDSEEFEKIEDVNEIESLARVSLEKKNKSSLLKITIEQFWFLRFSNSLKNSLFFSGKKPWKINFSEKPLIEIADVTDDGPGIGIISIFLSKHVLIKNLPGSDIVGVPASDIKDTIFFEFKISIIFLTFFFSLNLWFEIKFDLMWYLSNSFFETLVSSHKI